MWIHSLKYLNFRNYPELSLQFKKRLIFFIGDNGEGKTNIIEGIQMFSTLKSFRDNTDDEIAGWNHNHYYIQCNYESNIAKTLEIGYSNIKDQKKKLKINGVELTKKADIIGELKTVTFSPIDMKILEGGPIERRKFIDTFLCSVNRFYMDSLLEYNKVLKHRNKLLKERNVSKQELEPWDKMLIERGVYISKEREKSIQNISKYFNENLSKLTGDKDSLDLYYLPNVIDSNKYAERLIEKREIDLRLGYTSVGIHRDDIFIGKGDLDLTAFGSQGQRRSAVIALKTSIFHFIKDQFGISPILLIDDVIRELDIKRREYFVNLLMECGQVFFTTTDLDGIKDYLESLSGNIQVFKVKSGIVMEEIL